MYFRKHGTKWYYRMSVTLPDGTKKIVERAGGKTKAEARKKAMLDAKKYMNGIGEWDQPEKIRLGDLWELFLKEYVQVNLKANSQRLYTQLAVNHVLPALGDKRLASIKSVHLQKLLNDMSKKYSKSTVSLTRAFLKSMYKFAIGICDFLTSNPMNSVHIPRRLTSREKARAFTDDEIEQILNHFKGKKFYMPILLSYHTGMRMGECLALKWSNVDFERNTISITSTLLSDGVPVPLVENTAKTASSVRTIALGETLKEYLLCQRAKYEREMAEYGSTWQDNDFVCWQENGRPITANNIHYFNSWCKERFGAGNFHMLRHTHATMLLEAGCDLEIVSKRLGHNSISTTANFYSHILDNRMEKSRHILNEIL